MTIIEREKKRVANLAAQHVSDGVMAGIQNFLRKHEVVVSPTDHNKQPLIDFVDAITCEYDSDQAKKDKYPKGFKSSFRGRIEGAVFAEQSIKALMALSLNQEEENFAKLCRVIGYGETLVFMDENKDFLLSLMNELRSPPKVILPDKKLVV